MPSWLLTAPSRNYFLDIGKRGCFLNVSQVLNLLMVILKPFWDTFHKRNHDKISPRYPDLAFPSCVLCNLLESSSSGTLATVTQNTHHIFFSPCTNIKGGQQLCERYELKRKPSDHFSSLHPNFPLVADFIRLLLPCKGQDFRLQLSQ